MYEALSGEIQEILRLQQESHKVLTALWEEQQALKRKLDGGCAGSLNLWEVGSQPGVKDGNITQANLRSSSNATNLVAPRRSESSELYRAAARARSSPWREFEAAKGRHKPGYGASAKDIASYILQMPSFDYIIGIVILANAVCIGIEVEQDLSGDPALEAFARYAAGAEHFFLCIYTVELLIHFVAEGWKCWQKIWVVFDCVVVGCGVISEWIVHPVLAASNHQGGYFFDHVALLRMVRLFRLARTLRLWGLFRSLWRLVTGIVNSSSTMLSTLILIIMTIYIFACIGVELISKAESLYEDEECAEILRVHFSTLARVMLTLMRFTNMDSVAQVYGPLVTKEPALAIYFGLLWLTVAVALMNLVTALLVEEAICNARADNEMQTLTNRRIFKDLTPWIRQAFRQLDVSNDRSLTIKEMVNGINGLTDIPRELKQVFQSDKLADLFDFFDLDGSGEVSEDELIEGVCNLAIKNVPLETLQTLQLLRRQCKQMAEVKHAMARLAAGAGWSGDPADPGDEQDESGANTWST